MLTNPNTLQVIENKCSPKKDEKTKKAANYNHLLRGEINKFNMESNVLVMSMVEGSDLKLERNNRLLNQNISNQEEKLKNRLASRSQSKHKTKDIR